MAGCEDRVLRACPFTRKGRYRAGIMAKLSDRRSQLRDETMQLLELDG
jgi:hypothetical protein